MRPCQNSSCDIKEKTELKNYIDLIIFFNASIEYDILLLFLRRLQTMTVSA